MLIVRISIEEQLKPLYEGTFSGGVERTDENKKDQELSDRALLKMRMDHERFDPADWPDAVDEFTRRLLDQIATASGENQ